MKKKLGNQHEEMYWNLFTSDLVFGAQLTNIFQYYLFCIIYDLLHNRVSAKSNMARVAGSFGSMMRNFMGTY